MSFILIHSCFEPRTPPFTPSLVCVSPEAPDTAETLNSLNFATRVSQVRRRQATQHVYGGVRASSSPRRHSSPSRRSSASSPIRRKTYVPSSPSCSSSSQLDPAVQLKSSKQRHEAFCSAVPSPSSTPQRRYTHHGQRGSREEDGDELDNALFGSRNQTEGKHSSELDGVPEQERSEKVEVGEEEEDHNFSDFVRDSDEDSGDGGV